VIWGVAALVVVAAIAWLTRRPKPHAGLHIDSFLHVNINCRDFAVSREFYERLGFSKIMDVAPDGEGAVARAVGMERYRLRGALLAHPCGLVVDLLEWQEPRSEGSPPSMLNQPGLGRIALTTTDLDADVATLRAAGVSFVSDAPGEVPDPLGGTTRFLCFFDPDGTVLELVELGAAMAGGRRAGQRIAGARLR
jgi:glyoxylase I family protein